MAQGQGSAKAPPRSSHHLTSLPPYGLSICLFFFFNFLIIFFPQPCHAACGILVLQPGMEPGPSAMRARSPNHLTTREFPRTSVLPASVLSLA